MIKNALNRSAIERFKIKALLIVGLCLGFQSSLYASDIGFENNEIKIVVYHNYELLLKK